MRKKLPSCVLNNFRYYRRNHLMISLMGLAIVIGLLIFLPSLFSGSLIDVEDYARYGHGMNILVLILTVIAGVITFGQERRSKTLKTLLTRPCSVTTRLLSHWVSLLTVGLGLLALHHLSFYWLLQEGGLTYGSRGWALFLYGLCIIVIGLGVSSFYASFLHPIVAGILTLLSWDLVAGQLLATPFTIIWGQPWGRLMQTIFDAIHVILPSLTPYAHSANTPIGELVFDFTVVPGLPWSLTKVVLYTLVTALVSFTATRLVLSRQNLI